MSNKSIFKKIIQRMLVYSLNSACKEQNLLPLRRRLAEIIPDLTKQYTSFDVVGDYLISNVRSQHSFQISLAQTAISLLDDEKRKDLTIIDIGDSSGTHLQYLQSLTVGTSFRTLSVNLDPVAVKKIRDKGLNAIECRAELLHEHPEFDSNASIFLSYEMLEHLLDPVSFLHSMSSKSVCDYLVVTVPYLHCSRVGLYQIRHQIFDRPFNAESTHIFELSPDDWDLLFKFSGWKIVKSIRYTQYPKNNLLTVMRYLWRRFDFDGFYGVILKKDDSMSRKYLSW